MSDINVIYSNYPNDVKSIILQTDINKMVWVEISTGIQTINGIDTTVNLANLITVDNTTGSIQIVNAMDKETFRNFISLCQSVAREM